jgi:haloalkane dehalogenase
MIDAEETFHGTFPFRPRFSTKPGFRLHYVDEGEGEPVVCLHGEPTWGYLYRNFIPPLSRTHRVIVPDHMGFGKSETPPDRDYTLATHVENLELLVEELDLQDITLVLQDWGGPIGGAFARRNAGRVKGLFLMNTVVPIPVPEMQALLPALLESRWFRWIRRGQEEGWLEEVLGNLGSTVLSVMKIVGFENSAAVDDTWIWAYSAPFSTRAECKGAIAFPLDVVSGRSAEFQASLDSGVEELRGKPVALAEGMQDHAIPPEVAIGAFRAQFPGAPVIELEQAGHFCQEDEPELLVALLQQFLQSS